MPPPSTNLKYWVEADSGTLKTDFSTPCADGDNLGQWNDQSTNANNANNASSTLVYHTNVLSGLPGITCPGTSTGILNDASAAGLGTTGDFTLHVLIKTPSSMGTAETIFVIGNGTGGGIELALNTSSQQAANEVGTQAFGNGSATLTASTVYILSVVYNNTAGTAQYYLNGVADGSLQSGLGPITVAQAKIVVGGRSSTRFFSGIIFGLWYYQSAQGSTDLTNFFNYVNGKWISPAVAVPRIVDVTQSPYSADPTGVHDATTKIQQAIDDIYNDMLANPGDPAHMHTLYFPGNFLTSRPLLCDPETIKVKGDGRYDSAIYCTSACDVLQIGMQRNSVFSTTPILDSTYWPNITGTMDGTAGYTLHGLRTKGDSYAEFSGTPFDRGNGGLYNWSKVGQLTLDFAFNINAAGGWNQAKTIGLFALGNASITLLRAPCVLMCVVSPSLGVYRFFFTTSDNVLREADIPIPGYPTSTALQRCTIQIDLTTHTIDAWCNGTLATIDLTNIGAGWSSLPSTTTLAVNEFYEFKIGTQIFAGTVAGNVIDLTICGYKQTMGLIYQSGVTPQARIDSGTVNDFSRYYNYEGPDTFTGNTNGTTNQVTSVSAMTGLIPGMLITGPGIPTNTYITGVSGTTLTLSANTTSAHTGSTYNAVAYCCFLPLNDAGNAYRQIPWNGNIPLIANASAASNEQGGYGFFAGDNSLSATDSGVGFDMENMQLQVYDSIFGRALAHGPIYDTYYHQCLFSGGHWNYGGWGLDVGSTYQSSFNQCIFFSAAENVFGAQEGFLYFKDCTFKYWGRLSIRTVAGFTKLDNVIFAPGGPGEYILKFHHSYGAWLTNGGFDFEGGGPPHDIWCEVGYGIGRTQLTLDNWTFGTRTGTGAPIVLSGPTDTVLHDSNMGYGYLTLRQVQGLVEPVNIELDDSFTTNLNDGAWIVRLA